jgi:replicative DNA helicase
MIALPVPTDPRAERAVLGGLLGDRKQMAAVAALCRADDFFEPAHQIVFGALLELEQSGQPFDPIIVAGHLNARGLLGQVGGVAYLAELDTAAPNAANAEAYARIVAELGTRRRLMDQAKIALERLARLDGALPEIASALAEAAQDASAANQPGTGLQRAANAVIAALDGIEASQKVKGISGLTTGIDDLDRQLSGLHPGELLILAARPGVGKSTLALNMVAHVAVERKKPAAVFSLEMPADQLAQRLLASEAKVSLKKMREGGLSEYEMSKINTAAANVHGAPIYIDESSALTVFDVRARVRALKQREPDLALVAIDYLQLMSGPGGKDSREQEVAQISRGLKQLAKELKLPILALSQLNRKVEDRKGGRPMLSDLRESGSIEQDADVVMFIHAEERDEEDQQNGIRPGCDPFELIVAKQRSGPTGSIGLNLFAEYTRFEGRARSWEERDRVA